MSKRLVSGLLLAVLTLGWVGAAPQATAATSTCNGVWVVVDYGSLGGTTTKCAASHGTGKAALTSAGFSPTLDSGMITKISGKPANPDLNKDYWSYWTATLKADGSYSRWSYSNLGATSSHPAKGNAEGWRYQSMSGGKVSPGVAPPKGEVSTPTPTPTKSATKPTAKPKATKTPTASTRTPTTTASATRTASTSATPTASPTAGPSTPTPTVMPTTAQPVEASELAQQATGSEPPTPEGSPVGALVAGALVVAGAAGIGGWWWLRGRKR